MTTALRIPLPLLLLGLLAAGCAQSTPTPAPTPTAAHVPVYADPVILWSAPTRGAIWAAPTVENGIVYLGSDDGNLYAMDAANGAVKFTFKTGGYVRSRPAIAGDLVYISSDDGNVYAVNKLTGAEVWRQDIGNQTDSAVRDAALNNSPNPNGYDYVQSAPTVADGALFVGSADGSVYALNADTGAKLWTFPTGDRVRATPTVADGVVYVGSWDGNEYAIHAADGSPIWSRPTGGKVQTTALVTDGLVITASRKASVVALDAATGDLVWEHSYGTNLWVESSPTLVNGVVYIGSSGSKIVLGLEAKTGKPTAIFISKAFHWSTPLVVGNTLYIGGTNSPGSDNGLYALTLTDGHLPSDPTAGVLILPVGEHLPSAVIWDGVASSPVLAGGVIYYGGLDGKLYAVAPRS